LPVSNRLPDRGRIQRNLSKSDKLQLLVGDSLEVLSELDDKSINCCITSPPYWNQRQYETDGIGLEKSYHEYIENLLNVFSEVKRTLADDGSFWLNLGDSYHNKSMIGIPWRMALRMCDEQGWIMRNDVIWHKVKGGMDNSRDRLRNTHEHMFHFVKKKQYFYDVDSIRFAPKKTKVVNGSVVSATGVSGVRYKRQIELSTALSPLEKANALKALNAILDDIRAGKSSDFRMIIRGQQRTTHSDKQRVSGRAKELHDRGYYFLKYHPKGSKPSDVWDIIPEDSTNRKEHFAAFPEDLCRLPIVATCPQDGVVLDPFCGTGTALLVALSLGRQAIGIDISKKYLELARRRIETEL